ncbi:hypothetical protein FHS49_000246 [Sphingobium boeckii]|uniref:Uncharacterized protein n=1 Tax=Sphingobium boeckii TaxID=1082345 RepID=A0A7W9AEQ5_9SPHN|nr:hypothetical protein [Sphingobium boeckii]
MIRELEIIFGHHAVTLHLGVTRERLIFLEQLGGIAAGTVVDAATLIRTALTALWALLAATAATTAGLLTIIYQVTDILGSGVKSCTLPALRMLPLSASRAAQKARPDFCHSRLFQRHHDFGGR